MSVGLKYLYQEIKKYNVELIAGKEGLKNKVRWTNLVENEEIAFFLQGNEFIFTTGMGLNNEEDLLRLIRITKEKNASGIALYIGKHIKKVNEDIINYCNENDYPLFTIPWGIQISTTMREITIKIIESERTYLEISNALKDAIFLPEHKELYMPILKKVGYKLSWQYSVCLIEIESKDKKSYRAEEHTSEIIDFIETELGYMRNEFFAINLGQSIVIIFYNKTYEELVFLIKKLYIEIVKHFKDINIYTGIEKQSTTLEKLYLGYEEVKNIAKINRLLRNKNVHMRYSDLGLYKLMLAIEDKEKIKEFYDDAIGELETYDNINNTDYVNLLTTYFENNCKINETANELYVHRNTVNYKINKIEEILDINLSDIGNKSKIYVALMMRYLK